MSSVNSDPSSSSSSSTISRDKPLDPVTRNALRYTVSAKEYKLLHRYLISKAPPVKKRTPRPQKYEATVDEDGDYNASTIRATLRVGISTFVALRLWDVVKERLLARGRAQPAEAKIPVWKSPNVRLSASLSLILLFHRLLHRFLIRLRESLMTDNAQPFRRRNPRIARALTSKVTPAIGAGLAGLFLGVYPADQLRITVTIYAFTRALEYGYNHLEDEGCMKWQPWWLGSWTLMPLAFGQLLHAFVFDRDCFPESYGSFILKRSPEYIQKRPDGYPSDLKWPSTFDIVDGLGEISRLKWPAFTSPILFPNAKTLPTTLVGVAPITDPAHPGIKHMSCALLHPQDPSCLRTYISYWIQAFPPVARFFTIVFTAFSVLRYKAFMKEPLTSVNKLAQSILRMSIFITGSIGTAWGSICLFQQILPRNFLPTQRWFLSGFIAGSWAFLERKAGRSNFMYSARLSLDSLWKVGVKHGWWKGIKNGDVLLFAASIALINATYEVNPKAVQGAVVRKGLGVFRGDGWVDRAIVKGQGKEAEKREAETTGEDLLPEEKSGKKE